MEQLFIDLEKKAVATPQRLVLPESFEPRTLQAANLVIERGAAKVILIGDKNEIVAKANVKTISMDTHFFISFTPLKSVNHVQVNKL